jgi:hypothetical protein
MRRYARFPGQMRFTPLLCRIPDKVGVMGTNNEFRRSFRPLRQVYGRSEVFFLIGDPAPVARNGRGFVVQRTYGGRGRE